MDTRRVPDVNFGTMYAILKFLGTYALVLVAVQGAVLAGWRLWEHLADSNMVFVLVNAALLLGGLVLGAFAFVRIRHGEREKSTAK